MDQGLLTAEVGVHRNKDGIVVGMLFVSGFESGNRPEIHLMSKRLCNMVRTHESPLG